MVGESIHKFRIRLWNKLLGMAIKETTTLSTWWYFLFGYYSYCHVDALFGCLNVAHNAGIRLDDYKTCSNMLAQEVRLLLRHTATRNSAIFHRVFPALPHQSYKTLKMYNMAILKKRERRPKEAQSQLYLNEVNISKHFLSFFLNFDESNVKCIHSFTDTRCRM